MRQIFMRLIIPIPFLLMMILLGCDDASRIKPPLGAALPTTNPSAAAARSKSSDNRDISTIAATYKTFRVMTPGAVPVSAALVAACAPAIPTETKFSRETKIAHGAKVTIFMNESAATAFADQSTYPPGSVVVKQKETIGVGGMIKREAGYDAAHGDWEFF